LIKNPTDIWIWHSM